MAKTTRIVIVNDHPEFLELMAQFLGEEQFEVITFPKHQGAFQQIKELKPDLVICDLLFDNMPAGWALLDMLHLDPETHQIPLILCTVATREVQEVVPSLDAKGIIWLEKPFTLDQLLAKINAAMGRRGGKA